MSRAKPTPIPLCELTPGQHADFFALLAEKTKGTTREGKPYYACRFRDARRGAAFMVWQDSSCATKSASATGRSASSTSSAPSTASTNATARS